MQQQQQRPRATYTSAAPAARRAGGAGAPMRSGSGTATRGAGSTTVRSNGGGGGGSAGKRKRKVTRAQKFMRLSLVVFIVLVLTVCGILLLTSKVGSAEPPETLAEYAEQGGKYREGVMIAGADVSGLTVLEAKPKVETAVSTLMNGVSITLEHEEGSFTFTAADMRLQSNLVDAMEDAMAASAQKDGAASFPVAFTADRDAIISRLNAVASEINTPAVEPHAIPELTLEPLGASFTPVEGRDGQVLNAEATADLIVARIAAGELKAEVTPVFDALKPSMSLEFIMENTKKITSFSTKYKNSRSDETQQNRCFNIQKAADIINCYVAQAGEVWSFNGHVGPRTGDTGWKKANGISKGKEFTLQYGGGICQVSTTLYGALLRGNIEIPDGGRRKHTIPSTYVDKGLDATVDTSGIDLQFKNDTGAPLYIFAYTVQKDGNNYEMVVSLYGKPLPDGVRYLPVSEVSETIPSKDPVYTDDPTIPVGYQLEVVVAREGYKADVYMEKYENDKLVSREKLYTDTYGGNAGEYKRGTGDPLTVKVPQGATLMPGYSAAPAQDTPDTVDDSEQLINTSAQ